MAAGLLVLSTHVPLGQVVLQRGIIFIDLRDRWGVIQVAVDPSDKPVGLEEARAARLESVPRMSAPVNERRANSSGDSPEFRSRYS